MKRIGLIGGISWSSTIDYYRLIKAGAKCIILGCTEIPLILNQNNFQVPVFDTARIHAQAAVDFALSSPQETNP